jgi:tagatose-6-phosphate ketose/aldose isomerase
MNQALQELLSMAPAEKERRGLLFTAAEIAGQAGLWPNTYERCASFLPAARPFLEEFLAHPRKSVVLCGAGTSEYVGYCIEGLLRRRLGVPVNTASTTALVVSPQDLFVPGHAVLLVSFARSGSSPESLGAVRIAEALADPVYHLILTANAEGELAREAASLKRARLLALDSRTNDRSLAMTAAFSNLVVAGQALAHAGSFSQYERLFARIVEAGGRMLERGPDALARLARGKSFERAVFLGDGAHFGTAIESRLKLQEMTGGAVMCAYDTFPGLRHGPEAVIDERTLVVAFLSEDPFARRYELDLLAELRAKRIGRGVLAVAGQAGEASGLADVCVEYDPEGGLGLPAEYAPPVQVIAGQLLALFCSLARGLKPDNPSEAGVIHRVVEGVKVYDPAAFRRQQGFRVLAER